MFYLVYAIAVAMGFIAAINLMLEKAFDSHIGTRYSNQTYVKMSSLGYLSFFVCDIPAAVVVGWVHGSSIVWAILESTLFIAASIFGSRLFTIIRPPVFSTFNRLVSPFTLPINAGLAATAITIAAQ